MIKQSINLIIKKKEDTPFLKKWKLIASFLGIGSLSLFVILFIASMVFVNNNIAEFNHLKREVEQLEKKIGDQKSSESIYILTVSMLDILRQILSNGKDFSPLVGEITKFEDLGIAINSAVINKNSKVSFSITASSSAILNTLVAKLEEQDEQKIFSDIAVYGITRNKTGHYNLTISLKSSPSLMP